MIDNSQSRLLIKVISNRDGSRMCAVDPNMCISSLRKSQAENDIFVYKGQMLLDNLTFKYYSINDGDIICSLTRSEKTRDHKIRELERLRMVDVGINKLYGNHVLYRKASIEWIKVYQDKLVGNAPIQPPKFVVPEKLSAPSAAPLPSFWGK